MTQSLIMWRERIKTPSPIRRKRTRTCNVGHHTCAIGFLWPACNTLFNQSLDMEIRDIYDLAADGPRAYAPFTPEEIKNAYERAIEDQEPVEDPRLEE